ncbi:olfactory receptor 5V1-like [Pseudophryne corroboree]|uniref:olfactory receptor 5V1-like n=1 Tax=Pseudophryne corroboree TaxID=495146 RepID=UPI00308123EB
MDDNHRLHQTYLQILTATQTTQDTMVRIMESHTSATRDLNLTLTTLTQHLTHQGTNKQNMENNKTWLTGFTLQGLTDNAQSQPYLFVFFLVVYVLTVLGNSLMVITVTLSPVLHSPMYFFICNLAIVDMCYTTSTVPKLLLDFLSDVKRISFFGCVVQLYSFISFGGVECVLLAAMAGDRYVAICMPLHYTKVMSWKICTVLAITCWTAGLLNSLAHTVFTFRLPFCKSTSLNHFFCDIPPLLALSCADTTINEIVVYTSGGSVIIGSFLLTIMSYVFIAKAILKITTASGRQKAISTCASHLTVVILYFGTAVFTYIRPTSTYSLDQDRVGPVLYGIITPMLNPIIYSFRNKEVQGALLKLFAVHFTVIIKKICKIAY